MPDTLPNFRNLGVVFRVVVIANGLSLFVATSQATSMPDLGQRMIQGSAFLQPVLLSCLFLLYAFNAYLYRLKYLIGSLCVLFLVGLVSGTIYLFGSEIFTPSAQPEIFFLAQHVLLGITVAALSLSYFHLRTLSLTPAISDARLQALQARIRPHFLFNSINAVLGIVRNDVKRAETALEDMSDLFRMAMADNRELVTLQHEIALSRQYLALEQLRLGSRLIINWQIQDMPQDALIPPLVLQPLLENAVYHGIEPLHEGGAITIKLYRSGKEVHLDVYNPCQPQSKHHAGNKMALANIRERLSLQFDMEARYTVDSGNNYYHVHILIPYVNEVTQ